MSDRVRWAVIGYGRFGAIHAEVLSQADDCELVAVCTRNEQRLAEATSRYPGIKATRDYRQILDDPQIDAVSITTHVADHYQAALDALASGKHVLLEKPMAENTQQCREIVAAARTAAGRFMVGHVCRFDPRVTVALDAVREGRIGRIFAMRSKRNLPVAPGPLRLDKISALLGDGVHDADLMMWFMNEAPRRVYGRTVRVENFRYPDAGWAMLEFGPVQGLADQPSALGVVETNWRLPANTPTTIDAVLEIVGTQGQITIDCGHTGLNILTEQGLRMPDTYYWPQQHGHRVGALVNEIAYFTRCIREDRPPEVVTPEDAARAVAVIEAAERSAASGMPQEVETF